MPIMAWVHASVESALARACLALFFCLAVALCFLPGFNILNYYASLVLAIPGAILAACLGVEAARNPANASVRAHFVAAARSSVVLGLVPLTVLLLNAFRVKNCDLWEGGAFYLAGAGASMLFASQIGAAASLFLGRRRALLAAVLIVLGWIAMDAVALYVEPAIYAYNPFVGFFSGAIYDDVITLDQRLGLYRLFNLCQLCVLWAAVATLWEPTEQRVRLARLSAIGGRGWARLAVATVVTTVVGVAGAQIGFDPTRETIASALGGELRSERVILHYDDTRIIEPEARRILADHHFHLERLDEVLGERYTPVIRSFVYSDRTQKRRLMGARRVEVAKPWLREIHLTWPGFGAAVVRHELAHVVLGRDAPWPLHVPAMARLIPHAALVEGAAEALEWSGGDLTLHQWSAALHRSGLDVDITELMGPDGFYAQPAGKAYTLSGSFMRWLLDTRGAEPFRAVYRDADFVTAYGQPLATLMEEWSTFLKGVALPTGAQEMAKQRFDRKAIFFRVCPLEIARLRAEMGELLTDRRGQEALEVARHICELAPNDVRLRLELVGVLSLLGKAAAARTEAEVALSSAALSPLMRARFGELVADADWRSGDTAAAATGYAEVLKAPLNRAGLRVVAIKRAIASDPHREPILGPYLMGPSGPADKDEREAWVVETLAYLTDAVADLSGDPLALYLLGRRLAIEQRYAEALGPLGTALGRLSKGEGALPESTARRVTDELQRIEAVVLLHTGKPLVAAERFDALAKRTPWPGRALQFGEWAERARWEHALSLTR